MNKKGFLFCLFTFFYYFLVVAQHNLSGIVLNNKGKPLEYATVSVYPVNDNKNVKGVITDKNGAFQIKNLNSTLYKMVIQMLGFKDYEQQINVLSDINSIKIQLEEDITSLDEVEIIAEVSQLESRLGKKILRIGKDLSNDGSTALEAIERIPSVTATPQGGVQIRGSSDVIIYVNGKETKRDASTLQFISAEVLEKIEVITNPSAKYDAEGVAGIINLVYKKEKKSKLKIEGILNLALPKRFSAGFNASIGKDKFSFYASFISGRSSTIYKYNTERINFEEELNRYENRIKYVGTQIRRILNSGISFEPDSTLSMNFEINYDRWDDKSDAEQINVFQYISSTTPIFFLLDSELDELEDEATISFSLNKEYSASKKLKLLLSVGGEDEDNSLLYETINIEEFPEEVQQFLKSSIETEKQRLYLAKIDYEASFFKFGSFEAGVKIDIIKYDIFQKVQLQDSLTIVPDNDFSIEMNKYAVYFLQKNNFGKFEYAIGVRFEDFSSEAIQRSNQESFTKNSSKLFPSLQLEYQISDRKHTIGFNFTRRINNPGFFDVNPYVSFEDLVNLQTGNPDLDPEIANLYELNYHINFGLFNTDVTIYRRETFDVIQNIILPLNENQTIQTFENFDERIDQGIEVQIEYRAEKVFKTYGTFVLSQANFKDTNNAINLNREISWGIRLNQQLKFKNQLIFNFSENYIAPRFEPQRKTLAQFQMNFSVSKKFNKKKGSISLNFRDIFNTRKFTNQVIGDNFILERSYKLQTQRVTLSLRYNIFN